MGSGKSWYRDRSNINSCIFVFVVIVVVITALTFGLCRCIVSEKSSFDDGPQPTDPPPSMNEAMIKDDLAYMKDNLTYMLCPASINPDNDTTCAPCHPEDTCNATEALICCACPPGTTIDNNNCKPYPTASTTVSTISARETTPDNRDSMDSMNR